MHTKTVHTHSIEKKVNTRYRATMMKHSNILSLREEIIGSATWDIKFP